MNLKDLGWTEAFQESFDALGLDGLVPARVFREDKGFYQVYCQEGRFTAEVTGRFIHHTSGKADFPAVGDWVAVDIAKTDKTAVIHDLVKRASCFSRQSAGTSTGQQVLASNIDTAFLVSGMDQEFNPRRIERYLTLAGECRIPSVIVLNKVDLCEDTDGPLKSMRAIAGEIPVLMVSALAGIGMGAFDEYLTPGRTTVFLGSSGVGKSTLINHLMGYQRQQIGEVREYDGKGRHTTTRREMIRLPDGAWVIDTPGMREIQLWADEESLKRAFEDVVIISAGCRFRDCEHLDEPGCAALAAVESGELDPKRLQSYLKQKEELRQDALKRKKREQKVERGKWNKIRKQGTSRKKYGRRK